MTRYADWAFGTIPGKALRDAGFPGVIRYLSQTSAKRLKQSEVDDFRANGLLVHVVCQDGAADHDGGYAGGLAKARLARTQLLNLGWDGRTGCIYFAPFDSNETAASLPKTLDYFRGINSILPTWNTGVYGDTDTLVGVRNEGLASYFWQSASTSFGPNLSWATMHQMPRQGTVAGKTVDINEVLNPPTGAVFGGSNVSTPSNPVNPTTTDLTIVLRAVLNEATAQGFNSFAEMFAQRDHGLVDVVRDIYNATYVHGPLATESQAGAIGVNISNILAKFDELKTEFDEIKTLMDGIRTSFQEMDYDKLAAALLRQIGQSR